MTSMPRTEHHYTVRAHKEYTNFKWSLEDWTLLRDYYKTVVSPEFLVTNADRKTCILTFTSDPNDDTSIEFDFPEEMEFRTMKVSCSVLDENLKKIITDDLIFQNSDVSENILTTTIELSDGNDIVYLRNDTLTLLFEFIIVKNVEASPVRTDTWNANFGTGIGEKFKVILDSKDLYDVTFVVRGKKLYAHKVVLAANSEVFRSMFTAELKEENKGKEDNTVEVVDTDATVFEAFLCYMYTGQVSNMGNVVDQLIFVADKYLMPDLKEMCEYYMSNHVNNETAITYLLTAYKLGCTKLQKNAVDFVRVNIHLVGQSSALAKLSKCPSLVSQVFDKEIT